MAKVRILLSIIVLMLLACSAENSLIKKAREENTIDAYENYLSNYHNGKYTNEAKQKIEEIKFSQMRDSVFSAFMNTLKTEIINDDIATIKISPSPKILMGTPINIQLVQLPPNKTITFHAYRRRWNGLIYAFATYQSDNAGQVMPDEDEPLRGTYSGQDPLGIFWSMSWPFQQDLKYPFKIKELQQDVIYFAIECDDKILATDELELVNKLPHIISEKISNDTLTAIYHYPKDVTNVPALILLSGSEGGYNNINKMARIISSNGYAVLALAYFKIDPLPEHLEKIPLEYFFNTIDWIKRKSNVDSTKIIFAGGSRGGELALLLASLRRDIKGVVAVEPSCVLWQGLPHSPGTMFFPKPAWTLGGKALPFLKHRLHLPTMAKFGSGAIQIELMKLYEGIIDDTSKIESAFIKVENINGPILLIAGKDGQLWPSYKMCQMMEHRLDKFNFKHPIQCEYYDDAGHYVTITPDLSPTIDYKYEQITVGGTNSGNAKAQVDSWNKMIKFLKTYFPAQGFEM